jgi:uncharacterized protein (UPF0305 family)
MKEMLKKPKHNFTIQNILDSNSIYNGLKVQVDLEKMEIVEEMIEQMVEEVEEMIDKEVGEEEDQDLFLDKRREILQIILKIYKLLHYVKEILFYSKNYYYNKR